MKRKSIRYLRTVWTGFILAFAPLVLSQEVLDGIVAIVGEEIILRSELIQNAHGLALQVGIDPAKQAEEFEKLKRDVLDNLINEKVLLAKAIEDTVTVDDQMVESALDARIQEVIQQLGSREKVEAYIGKPIRQIKRDYRDEIRKQLIVQTLQQEKLKDIKISRREVEQFYATMEDSLPEKRPMVKLRHILLSIRPGEAARQKAMMKLREVQERLRSGASFEDLVEQYSEDPGTAQRGGDLGFVERGTLFQSFEEAAFQLKPGEVSDIVETPVGLHLIQLVEKRGDKSRVRHILVRLEVTEEDVGGALEELRRIRERALTGEDFGALAREYSQDPSTKESGGDLGWLPADDLQIQAFKSAVDTLQEGQISQPFETQFGYHIVKLEGKRPAGKYSLEEDWEQLREWAWNLKRQRVLGEWVEELKENVHIERKEDLL